MKDLEDLMPNRSLAPPPAPKPSAGEVHRSLAHPQKNSPSRNNSALTCFISSTESDSTVAQSNASGAACCPVAQVPAWEPEGWWFKPRCGHDKYRCWALVRGPKPHIAPGGDCPLLGLINCRSCWIKKASAE